MTADWPQIDSAVSLHAPNDLFGGDFFGDELNDMYISGGADIGTLQESITGDKPNIVQSSPANEVDHGLDSITFNDFTDLMPPEVATVSPVPSSSDSAPIIEVNANNKRPLPIPENPNTTNSTSTITTTVQNSATTVTNKTKPIVSSCTTNNKKRGVNSTANSRKQTKAGSGQQGQANVNAANANQKGNTGKKNAHTPNPLSSGNPNGAVASPLAALGSVGSGNVATPLPAPAAFANTANSAPMLSSQSRRMAPIPTTSAAPIAAAVPAPTSSSNSLRISSNFTKKGSASTIYAPSRQMCAPNGSSSKVTMKKMAAAAAALSSRASHNTPSSAIATAAAAASASPPDSSDFAAVAQAAVTNLMLNAGSQATQILTQKNAVVSDDSDSDPSSIQQRSIDTSTAHVTALTSPNWVAACASMTSTIPGTSVTAPVVSSNALPTLEITSSSTTSPSLANNANNHSNTHQETPEDDTPAAKRRRQNLNPEERAKQNRDRNREHARNTRLRKKAYVEELKRTLTELVAQRDAGELEKRRNAQRELEQREVRFRVMEEFLKLRGGNELNVARWVAILEDGFTLTLPFTNYRSVVKGIDANAKLTRQSQQQHQQQQQLSHQDPTPLPINTFEDKQILYGAPECMADATALSNMLTSFTKSINKVTLQYDCDRKRFLMDGTNAVLEWNAKSINHDPSTPSLTTSGSMRASFSPASNKLISCELCFDTGPIVSQLRKLTQYTTTTSNTLTVPTPTPQTSYPPPIHDDFAANIFGGGASADADRLLDSLDMPMLPTQSTLSRGISQKSIVSSDPA